MARWLMKSEPESYGWADLVRDGGTEWDGVRNNAARLHLQGDEARRRGVLLPQHVGQGGGRDHAGDARRRSPTPRTPTGSRCGSSRCGRSRGR